MKILHISTSDRGGAGIAAVRLHESLLQHGVDSKLLTLYKYRNDIPRHYQFKKSEQLIITFFKRAYSLVKRILGISASKESYATILNNYLKGRPKGGDLFSLPISEYKLEKHALIRDADIVHLHWTNEGFLDYVRFFKSINKKIVWTLHDMNPFTGGCHHADDCERFLSNCSNCPQLIGTVDPDLAAKMLAQKVEIYSEKNESNVSIIAPSEWLLKKSKASLLFKRFNHRNIYNIADTKHFFVKDQSAARIKLGLPLDKKIILFVANDINNPRKGINYLLEAFSLLKTQNTVLCSVGNVDDSLREHKGLIQLGYIMENAKMTETYNAANVFVLPSIAENFPNSIIESLFCGTPVVAFNVGGIPEQINDFNGITVNELSSQKLAAAIDLFFEKSHSFNANSISGEAKIKYNEHMILEAHLDLYKKLNA